MSIKSEIDRDIRHFYYLVALFCIFVIYLVIVDGFGSFNDTDYTVTVTDKERVNRKASKYLIFCKDSDGKTVVFENTDRLLRGKFNSSDIYGDIEIGKKYTFTVVGYRIPILSEYKNIIKVVEHE